MTAAVRLSADLGFSVSLPAENAAPPKILNGTLSGDGSVLELSVNDVGVLGELRALRGRSASLAAGLARHGVRLTITDSSGPVITIGDVDAGWLQRLLTGSRHVRMHRLRALRVRRRVGRQPAGTALPLRALVPPLPSPRVLPMAPTVLHPSRRPVTTTHDAPGGGDPRLIFSVGPHPQPGEQPRIFYLRGEVTIIGSGPSADLRLPGLAARHAEIRHDERDEFVLVRHFSGAGEPQTPEETVLRTGSRVELGEWSMSYQRAEWADHGRPYGGRAGGELGHQLPQPPRQRAADPSESLPEQGGSGS